MFKIFRRFDGLRKYFNTKILQHSVCNSVIGFRAARGRKERQARAGGRTYGESNCHGRVFRKELLYSRLPRSMGAAVGETLVCEREPENASDR